MKRLPPLLVILTLLLIVCFWSLRFKSRTQINVPDWSALHANKGQTAQSTASSSRLNKPADLKEKIRQAQARIQSGQRDPDQARDRIGKTLLGRYGDQRLRSQSIAQPPLRGQPRGYGQKVLNPAQQQAIARVLTLTGSGTELQMDSALGVLRHLRGDLSPLVADSPDFQVAQASGDYAGMAVATLQSISQVLNVLQPAEEFVARPAAPDELGMVHVKLDQQFQGLSVYGAQIIVHFNPEGQPQEVHGIYCPSPVMMPTPSEEIGEVEALAKAREAVGMSTVELVPPRVERLVYWDPNRSPVVSYHVDLTPSAVEQWHVFVAAADGSILKTLSGVRSAAATGQSRDLFGNVRPVNSWQQNNTFYAINTSLPMYNAARSQPTTYTNMFGAVCIFDVKKADVDEALKNGVTYVTSSNKDQWDPTAVSVMNNFGQIYDYYRTTHNRNSFDNQGINITGLIHARFKDNSGALYTDNAFFNPSMNIIVLGDGEVRADPGMLPAALDITAHEFTHGVVDHSAAFKYENQSGAMHEHMADYFACMIDRDDWINGEDAVRQSGKAGSRDLSDPHNPNVTSPGPKTMAEYRNLPNTPEGDLGGVHVNSTIPSYACFLFTDGPGGMGREKAERIVYRALIQYLTPNTQFIDYRRGLISAAKDLYPNGNEADLIKQAFDTIGLSEGESTPPPVPVPATSGGEYILFLRAEYEVDPWDPFGFPEFAGYAMYQLDSQGQFLLVAQQYLSYVRPAISGTGTWALYVGQDNNVYWTDGISTEQWTDTEDVRTIAMSKDLRYIAFTTIDYDSAISILDTQQETVRTAPLNIPTSGDPVRLGFADVMTFNCLNDFVYFDAFTEGQLGQAEYGCWGLYSLRIKDLDCKAAMPLTPGLQVGNPTLANTQGHLLVADYVYTTNNQETLGMISLDLNQKQMGILMKGLDMLAAPSFRGDDSKIVFQTYENGMYYLKEATFAPDHLSLNSGSVNGLLWSVNELAYPVGFRSGDYKPPAGELVIQPAQLVFNPVPVGQAVTNDLQFKNQGNADLEIIATTLEGADIDAFDFGSVVQKGIGPGQTQTVKLVFHPNKTGPLSANLRAKTSAPGQSDLVIALQGTGQASPAINATNHWRQVWEDFQNLYSYFDHKEIDWRGVYAQYASEFANVTAEQFAEKVNQILQSLHDWHVVVRKPDGTYIGYEGSYVKNCSGSLFARYTDGQSYTNVNKAGVIYHAWVDRDIAHVLVDTLTTSAFQTISDADIENIFVTYVNAAGFILDIRDNSGGNEMNAKKLASRFTDAARTYGYVRPRVPDSMPFQYEDFIPKTLEPSTGTRFLKPAVALIGQRNMSSAEWFTLMLRACPNVILIGDRTRGASGNPTTRAIPELNVEYDISTWIAYTDLKIAFEDRGIPPAIHVPASQSYSDEQGRDFVLEQAIAYLRWRQNQGTALARVSGASDLDQDRQPDIDEYLAGTNPADPKSWFGFQSYKVNTQAGGGNILGWSSTAGARYSLWRSTSQPSGFILLKSDITATPPLNQYTDTTADPRRPVYYRLEQQSK